ncbi:HNH endonuclease signature motif containing protein [Streptomyces sp. ODS05-4]|uniref:HNH endonuclease signature motif containing protein n=1 Tax=Streptomyces sp. ODS05-4 TaxID=2944939 RepID=UPI00210ED2B9|nr:HNH endonuclease signature motif containing protein [Streptomyces sp. ODS05-4]
MPVSPYTRERLAEVAAASRTLSEALGALGVDPRGAGRAYIRERMRRFEVDTSHFEREGLRWTRSVLEPAVAASTNMTEVLRRLGIDAVGGNHTHISRRVRTLGIDTSHFTRRVPRARTTRRADRSLPAEILVLKTERHPKRTSGVRLRRAMTASGVPDCCALCGQEPLWRGRPLPLEVDHISGNWRDNRIGNLRILCPNCHSATDTYRGRKRRR